MRILSLDCSSTTVGFCVLEITKTKKIKFIHCAYFKPPKKGNLFERLKTVKNEITALVIKYKITHAAIEDIVLFMPRKSTAATIVMLATFNRMVGLTLYELLGKPPELLSVLAIRHRLKLTPKFPQKDEMPSIVASHLGIKFTYEFKKNGKLKDENYDRADAIAVGLVYAYQLIGK